MSTVPAAPVAPTCVFGNHEVTLNWTAPTNGGSTINGYNFQKKIAGQADSTYILVLEGGSTASSGVATKYTAKGLTNGVSYVFRVAAKNSIGLGPWSPGSLPVVPSNIPGRPDAPVCLSGNGQVTLNWVAPETNIAFGGAPITDYIIQRKLYGSVTYTTVADGVSSATTYTNTGLTNSSRYVYRIAAVNASGVGMWSLDSLPVTPSTTPGVPTGLSVVPGVGSVTLSWVAPANGGAAITDYVFQKKLAGQPDSSFASTPDISISLSPPSSRIQGLTKGTSYIFRVAAVNVRGTSPYSANSAAVAPK